MKRGPLLSCATAVALLAGCSTSRVQEPGGEHRSAAAVSTSERAAEAPVVLSSKLSRAAPERLVAIGDLHGDLDHARKVLRLAGAIDDKDHWIGEKLVVVQTGDRIDRGDDDRAIEDLFLSLSEEAKAKGGEVIALLGNHEIMNAALDFRYVTPGAFAAFDSKEARDATVPGQPEARRGRALAFEPGGAYAEREAERPLVVKVGQTVFVHGGVLPKHVAYGLDRMNDELDDWLRKKRPAPPEIVVAQDGPVWTRAYSTEDAPADCKTLREALARLGATRMVVGHTVQKKGVNAACDGAVYRIDVGLSRFFGGPVEALEIKGNEARVLREGA